MLESPKFIRKGETSKEDTADFYFNDKANKEYRVLIRGNVIAIPILGWSDNCSVQLWGISRFWDPPYNYSRSWWTERLFGEQHKPNQPDDVIRFMIALILKAQELCWEDHPENPENG